MAELRRVTITGADDSTSILDLVALSAEFPFVEWGFLLGRGITRDSSRGKAQTRFPSHAWLRAFANLAAPDPPVRYALHLCGAHVRAACKGKSLIDEGFVDDVVWQGADRVQLNFHRIAHQVDPAVVAAQIEASPAKWWVLQIDGRNDQILHDVRALDGRAIPLFDRSGGQGVTPGEWPRAFPGMWNGYAGGLGPKTLKREWPKIQKAAGHARVWLDMETGVRDADDTALDFDRMRKALALLAPHVMPDPWPDG